MGFSISFQNDKDNPYFEKIRYRQEDFKRADALKVEDEDEGDISLWLTGKKRGEKASSTFALSGL